MNNRKDDVEKLQGVVSLLGFGSSGLTFCCCFDLLHGRELLRLCPIGLVHLSCSRDLADCDDEDASEIVDVEVRFGRLSDEELSRYGYRVDPAEVPDLWSITFDGSMWMNILCKDFRLEHGDLASKYPHLKLS